MRHLRRLLAFIAVCQTMTMAQTRTTNCDDEFPGALTFGPRDPATRPAGELPQLSGFPTSMTVNPLYAPSGVTLADLDGDDTLEIVAASTDGKLYAWRANGTPVAGFPVTVGNRIQAAPAVGDIDNDGSPDIAVFSVSTTTTAVSVYRANGSLMPGWPKTAITNAFGFSAPVLYDFDGDGKLEVIQGTGSNTQNLGRIFIWRYDGSAFPGWPQTLGDNYRIVSTVSVGDIDNDGSAEIIAVGKKAGADTVKVFAYHNDSTIVAGWPYTAPDMGASWSAAAIGNIDTTTATSEVAFTGANFFGGYGNLYVVNANGTTTTGFPAPLPLAQNYPSVVLGDIDRDGVPEIVCGGTGNEGLLFAFRNDGTRLTGWPQAVPTNMEGTPIIVNVDATDTLEVIDGDNFTSNGSLYAFTASGSQAPPFPITMAGGMGVNSAAAGDIDLDGVLDLALVNTNGTVNAWTTGIPSDSANIGWGTFYHDNYHTGNYHFRPRVATSAHGGQAGSLPEAFRLGQNYPNPFNPETTIDFAIPSGGNVLLAVYDVLGRQVALLLDGHLAAGGHSIRFAGSGFASGVYYYRFSFGGRTQTRAMMLVR